jgi:hypothetical protein
MISLTFQMKTWQNMWNYKKVLIALVTLVLSNSVFAQLTFKNTNNGRFMDLTDISGRTLVKNKYDPDVQGTPFLNPDWDTAKITLSNGMVLSSLFIKLNIESNELYYLDSAHKEMIAMDGLVKKIEFLRFYDRYSIPYVFKTGYPKIDKQNEIFFYQVFTEGKLELLMKNYKSIRIDKKEMSGEVTKDFIDNSWMYLYANNAMIEFKKDKSAILLLMKDKEKEINQYLSTNKISFKKTVDLIKLFNYYNSL